MLCIHLHFHQIIANIHTSWDQGILHHWFVIKRKVNQEDFIRVLSRHKVFQSISTRQPNHLRIRVLHPDFCLEAMDQGFVIRGYCDLFIEAICDSSYTSRSTYGLHGSSQEEYCEWRRQLGFHMFKSSTNAPSVVKA